MKGHTVHVLRGFWNDLSHEKTTSHKRPEIVIEVTSPCHYFFVWNILTLHKHQKRFRIDHASSRSYTPSRISIRIGTAHHDLQEALSLGKVVSVLPQLSYIPHPSSLIPTDPKYDFTMGPGTWVSPVSLYRLLGWNGKVQQLELKEPDGVLALKGCQAEKCLDVNGKLIKHLHFFFWVFLRKSSTLGRLENSHHKNILQLV